MRILIAAGIYPPQIGGIAYYAKNLAEAFRARGHEVKILTYNLERRLPYGARHFLCFLRALFYLRGANFVIALDTMSVGLASLFAAGLLRKRIILRLGGDFLWEAHVERTKREILLSDFYKKKRDLNIKERIIFRLTKFLLRACDAVVFSTKWQRDIFIPAYSLNEQKVRIIENFYGEKEESNMPRKKNFLWAGRPLFLKNTERLKNAFAKAGRINPEINLETGQFSLDILMEKIRNCYAVIVPSVSEVSPNLILDSIRFNKPFICTRETGLYEKLKDAGVFVSPLDEEDIKNKILFLADGRHYQEYKKQVESFRFTHSWQEIADEFLALYKTL